MNPDLVTTIDLLRHGEPAGGERYRGRLDDPLSELGWAQMRAAVGEHHPWQVVISSPLRRCADFARELAARHELPVEIEPDFREMSFGAWEGFTIAEVMATNPASLDRFYADPITHPPPGGESLADCNARVTAAWKTVVERHAGRHLLVVGHGGVIRLVLCHLLEIPLQRLWRLEVPYAALSRVRVHGWGAQAEPMLVFHAKNSV